MPRVIHFELPADDPERACRFYADVFGWTAHKWDGPADYWLLQTGEDDKPGINGGIMRTMSEFPARTPINAIDVPSVDEYAARVEAAGGKIVVPKLTLPGIGYLAYGLDTEGVLFGIMQSDPTVTS
jgi:predicted enzyme related to lactoylglutathione lyase